MTAATPLSSHMSSRLSGASLDPTLMQPLDAQARRALMRGGSKTFFAASMLLPSRVREPATALYAYCRLADDAVDLGHDPHAAGQMLAQRLDAIYEGRPGPAEADRALAQVVHRFAIPRALVDALLEGFLWDAQGRRYHSLSDVQAYGARVAGTVGAMMALVMDTRGAQAVARACELGVAMQLTNIARDVGEDARNGRLYLPRDWLAEAGVDADAWLQSPVFTPAIATVVQRLLRAADVLYARAEAGIADLPLDCRPAIQAACRVYAEIGHQLEREGLDSISHRAVVSRGRKIALLATSTGAALLHSPFARKPLAPLPEIAFLVEAVQQCEARGAAAGARSVPRRSFEERMEWATSLHARLVEREQQRSQERQSRA
jgi:15-cis-phytoene synthase